MLYSISDISQGVAEEDLMPALLYTVTVLACYPDCRGLCVSCVDVCVGISQGHRSKSAHKFVPV